MKQKAGLCFLVLFIILTVTLLSLYLYEFNKVEVLSKKNETRIQQNAANITKILNKISACKI